MKLTASRLSEILIPLFIALFLFFAGLLIYHAWKTLRLDDSQQNIRQVMNVSEIITFLDAQIENANRKIKQLEPGPPPPWFYPSYYLDWLPRAKLYAEAQEILFQLERQKREIIQKGKQHTKQLGYVWNFGFAPILHLLLALTLLSVTLRWMLRIVLWKGLFGWVCL